MKNKISYLLFLVVMGTAACNNNTDSTQEAKKQDEAKFDSTDMKNDALFAVKVADGGMLEIKSGELAEANAVMPVVKDLGKMMVDGHTKLAAELKAITTANNITIPDSLSDESLKKYNTLLKKNGKDFDKAFTQMMVDDHTNTIKAFEDEAGNGHDSALKDWATKTIPALQLHLQMSDSANDVSKSEK